MPSAKRAMKEGEVLGVDAKEPCGVTALRRKVAVCAAYECVEAGVLREAGTSGRDGLALDEDGVRLHGRQPRQASLQLGARGIDAKNAVGHGSVLWSAA